MLPLDLTWRENLSGYLNAECRLGSASSVPKSITCLPCAFYDPAKEKPVKVGEVHAAPA